MHAAIVRWITDLWQTCHPDQFATYMQREFGVALQSTPTFRCLYIAESAEGNIDDNVLGSILHGWLKMDNTGLWRIEKPGGDFHDRVGPYYVTPVLRYWREGNRVLLGERFSDSFIIRRIGTLPADESIPEVYDLRVISKWSNDQ